MRRASSSPPSASPSAMANYVDPLRKTRLNSAAKAQLGRAGRAHREMPPGAARPAISWVLLLAIVAAGAERPRDDSFVIRVPPQRAASTEDCSATQLGPEGVKHVDVVRHELLLQVDEALGVLH